LGEVGKVVITSEVLINAFQPVGLLTCEAACQRGGDLPEITEEVTEDSGGVDRVQRVLTAEDRQVEGGTHRIDPTRPAGPGRREPGGGSVVAGEEPVEVVRRQLVVAADHDEPAVRPPLDGCRVRSVGDTGYARSVCRHAEGRYEARADAPRIILPALFDGAALDNAAQRALFVARLRGGVNSSAIAAIADGTRR
jgi:hypothetical protein